MLLQLDDNILRHGRFRNCYNCCGEIEWCLLVIMKSMHLTIFKWGCCNLLILKLLSEVLKLHSSQWLHQHIIYLFIHHNILELHYSSLHHIPNIVILDSICFDLSWNTGFSNNFTQLWLLQYIQVASNWRSNKSDSSFLSHTSSHSWTSCSILYFSYTQCHTRLLPAKPRDHNWSHTEETPWSALPINGTAWHPTGD